MPPTLKQRLRHMFEHSLSTNGRISRQEYWLSWAVFVIFLLVVIFIIHLYDAGYVLDPLNILSPGSLLYGIVQFIFFLVLLSLFIFPLWFIVAQTSKRFHDISKKVPDEQDDEEEDSSSDNSGLGCILFLGSSILWPIQFFMFLIHIIILLIHIIWVIILIPWLLIADSYADENIYGPVPTDEIGDEE